MTPTLIELIQKATYELMKLQLISKEAGKFQKADAIHELIGYVRSIPEMPQVDDYKTALKTLLKEADNLTEHLTARIEQLEGALKIVAEWDLPKTGKTWESGGEMSYEAAFGTNGSRDYMKQIASSALLTSPPTKAE